MFFNLQKFINRKSDGVFLMENAFNNLEMFPQIPSDAKRGSLKLTVKVYTPDVRIGRIMSPTENPNNQYEGFFVKFPKKKPDFFLTKTTNKNRIFIDNGLR